MAKLPPSLQKKVVVLCSPECYRRLKAEQQRRNRDPNNVQALSLAKVGHDLWMEHLPAVYEDDQLYDKPVKRSTGIAWTWTTFANGDIEWVSDEAEKVTGLKVTGDNWKELIHPDDLEKSNRVFYSAIQNQTPWQVDHRVRMADGSYAWIRSKGTLRPRNNGEFNGFFGQATFMSAAQIKTATPKIKVVAKKQFRAIG